MNCQLEQVVKVVTDFVSARQGITVALTPTTRLFHEGYLDSFSLVELTAALESSLGAPLPDGALIPEDFETVQAVFDRLSQL